MWGAGCPEDICENRDGNCGGLVHSAVADWGGGGAAVPEHRTPDFFATKHEINPSLLSWHT